MKKKLFRNKCRSQKNISKGYAIRLLICTPIIIAMTIMELIFSNVTTKENSNSNKEIDISEDVTTSNIQSDVANVEPNVVGVKYSQYTLPAEEETEDVEELTEQEPLEWFLENDSTDEISIWKKTTEDGLLIQIRNEKEEVLSTFLLEFESNNTYEQWTECSAELTLSTSDLLDATFLAYREVGGKNSLNVQAQVAVLMNRVNYANSYGESIREVIHPGAYGSCYNIINRIPKSGTNIEREDLRKSLYQAILYFADEKLPEIETMPTNVVYAALESQGSGIWMEIDGTKYCYR